MSRERVYVIFGGPGGEREVSRISALGIVRNLDPRRWEVIPIGVLPDGRWFLQDWPGEGDDRMPLDEDPRRQVWVVPGEGLRTPSGPLPRGRVFPIVHGQFGEDGRLQGLLDWAGLPYVGSRTAGSALGMDKDLVKRVWAHAGLPVVDWHLLRASDPESVREAVLRDALDSWGWPLFIKPSNSGSSVGTSRIQSEEEWEPALERAFAVDRKVLVEPALSVREIECSVLQTAHDLLSFAPGEIVPTHAFYDYEAKYLDPEGARLLVPAPLEPSLAAHVRDLAVQAFRLAEGVGFARVDFFLETATGKLYVNEINTLPGFTPISMFPKLVEAGGISYSRLLEMILELAR